MGTLIMNYIKITVIILTIWNLIVFSMYGIDKSKSKRNKQRISEKTLFIIAALMGGTGALLGMYIFRHKTKHLKFKIGVPLLLYVNIIAFTAFIYITGFAKSI